MENRFAVKINERLGELAEQTHRLIDGERFVIQAVGQRASLQILHDVVGRLGVPAHFQKRRSLMTWTSFPTSRLRSGQSRPL
jgi:hypothetical protein